VKLAKAAEPLHSSAFYRKTSASIIRNPHPLTK